MKYDDSAYLSWKEILSLIDKYHKVNSFLVELVPLIWKNFILPKSLCVCVIRYIGEEGLEQGSEKIWQFPGGSTAGQSGTTAPALPLEVPLIKFF